MSTPSVLIFDRDAHSGSSLRDLLATWGYHPVLADDVSAALKAFDELKPAVVLDGGPAAESPFISQDNGDVSVLSIERPLDSTKLRTMIDRAVELNVARKENERLRRELQDRGAFGELVGNSESIRKIYTLIEQVAPSSASVLITGESGTGKELVARTLHKMSPRRDRPFVAINCSAIPETLMESELFGHEKGSFTGAATRRQGCFELADTGTLLLDEIGEMPPLLQAKLLRVIEERAVRRLGSRKEIEVDVRLLAATNRHPQQAVDEGKLRSDLLYRLNVFSIHLPSLGERKEDLPLLAQHLVKQLAEKHGRPARFMSTSALQALQFHAWPGNVRELRNVIERAVIICSGEQIERHHFAPYPIEQRERLRSEDTLTVPVGTPLEEVERQMIMRTLQKTKNNKTRAAELLGISLKTLHNKLNLYRERGLLHDE